MKILFILIDIAGHRLPQSAVADDNELIFLVQSQDIADFLIQIVDAVTIALLSETAKIIQILSDLRSRISDQIAQILGRNLFDSFFLQLAQISPVSRQSFDDGF